MTRELTPRERQQAVSALLARLHEGKPRRGSIKEVAGNFGVHARTISRLWKRAKTNAAQQGVYEAPTLKDRTGRRPRDLTAVRERLRHVDVQQRTTIRSAAVACGVPAATLFRRLKQGKLRSCTSVTRPLLTPANLQARIKFCLDHVDLSINKYRDMMDVIHVDEKYFFLTVVKRRFIMLHDEPDPVRKLKSKRHITKVMILSAVARPRYNEAGECIFDGSWGRGPSWCTRWRSERAAIDLPGRH
jgi:transposase-like protein